METTPNGQEATLKFLKILVTSLTTTMIVGLIVLIGLIVMRFSGEASLTLPDHIALPEGAEAASFTRGTDWLAIVTSDGRILIYDMDGETLRQEIRIDPAK